MSVLEKMKGLVVLGFLCILCFFGVITLDLGSLEFCGFGVDGNGLLYVGRSHQIEVYDDRVLVNSFPTPAERGWIMTVNENSHILVSNMSTVFTLDNKGTVIATQADTHSEMYAQMKETKELQLLNHDVYQLKYTWIWPTILKNGSVIYQVPFADFAVRILFTVGSIFLIIGFVACKIDEYRLRDDCPTDI